MVGQAVTELTVKRIGTASLGEDLVFAVAEDALSYAQTVMLRRGFSQLPVHGTRPESVVSWRSIAGASISASPHFVYEALEKAATCSLDDELLGVIPTIVERDYVLVRDDDRIVGIVTAADLAGEFDSLARPFLVIGQCEQLLRALARDVIGLDALRPFAPPYARSAPDPTLQMTLHDFENAFCDEDNWAALNLRLEKRQFLDWLDNVRKLRNNVAHFREPHDEFAEQIYEAENLARLLRSLSR
jgi:CBS domain-containing protein